MYNHAPTIRAYIGKTGSKNVLVIHNRIGEIPVLYTSDINVFHVFFYVNSLILYSFGQESLYYEMRPI